MKVSIQNLVLLGCLSIGLTACGSGNNSAALLAATAAATATTGSTAVASGNIAFTMSNPYITATTVLGGMMPYGTQVAGTYGQMVVGTSAGSGGVIQYQQEAPGANGQFTLFGNPSVLYGNIILSASAMQALSAQYGPSAQVTQLGLWVVQNVVSSYGGGLYGGLTGGVTGATYTGIIYQVAAFFYINGSTQPVGPVIF
jgi:hypothetical protein